MITRSYDAVVIFPSPGAFTAAAVLASQGKQVLVVEEAKTGGVSRKYSFPSHRRVLAGMGGSTWLPQALREIQIHPQDISSLKRSEPLFQVVDSSHRLDVPSDPAALVSEIRREFGPRRATAANNLLSRLETAGTAYAETIQTALSQETNVGLLGRIGVKKISWSEPREEGDAAINLSQAAADESVDDQLLRFVGAPLSFLSCQPNPISELGLGKAGNLLMGALDGLYQDPVNPDAFHELLRRRVQGLKVDITSEDQPEQLVLGWGRLREIRFAGRKQPVRAESLITGDNPQRLTAWMTDNHAAQYQAAGDDLVPAAFLHSIRLGIAEEVVPEGMCDHVLLLPETDAQGGDGCLLISLTPAGSKGAPQGRRAMTVSCRLPLELADDPRKVDQASHRMLERVKELVPYLERFIEVVHIPQSGPPSETNPFPLDTRPAWFAAPNNGASAGLALPHRNVFYCGRGALPAMGLDGEVMAGMVVARLAAQVIRKGR